MTGFAYVEARESRFSVGVELKSYNNRYLDLVLTVPPTLNQLEERLRETIRSVLLRGRIECHIRFRDLQENLEISLDAENVAAYTQVLQELRKLSAIQEPIGLTHLLSMEGLVRIERQRDPELYWNALKPVMQEALEALVKSRAREGLAIRTDLLGQLHRIQVALELILEHAPHMEMHIRDNLTQRFSEVLGNRVEEQRMLAEVAIQLNRLTINEELVRLRAHMETALSLINGTESSGKRLDFLCQEMNREINTIGSKNVILEISNAVIEVKDALENVREQIRNVE